jgi:hypothetical protein
VVIDDEEAVEQTEGQGRHGEEIQRDDGFAMVLQECQPALDGIGGARRAAEQASRHVRAQLGPTVRERPDKSSATKGEKKNLPDLMLQGSMGLPPCNTHSGC